MPFEADVRSNARARRLSLRILPGGQARVTVPRGVPWAHVLRFLHERQSWAERTMEAMRKFRPAPPRAEARRAYLLGKEAARRYAYAAIAKFAPTYGVTVAGVSIRDQKSRWGSCSRDGRLAFNWRIATLPERLADYVVVHELCHLLEFNHSPRFWAQVARTLPDHRALRTLLHHEHPLHA